MTHKTDVLKTVEAVVADMVYDYTNTETAREDVLHRVFEEVDAAFGNLVRYHGRLADYDAHDMVRTAPACCAIIEAADDRSWIADNSGLWEGIVYGTLAAVAFHSLENLVYSALEAAGVDTNDDFPFAAKKEAETA